MKPQAFAVTPQTYPRPLNVLGEKITVLADHAATHGYEIFPQHGIEGSGPPPRDHDWDETFYVTGGTIEFTCDGTPIIATAGTLVHVPAGTIHSFRFGADGGDMLSITGHNSRAASMFATIDRDVSPGPPEIPKIVEIAGRYGVQFGV